MILFCWSLSGQKVESEYYDDTEYMKNIWLHGEGEAVEEASCSLWFRFKLRFNVRILFRLADKADQEAS